MLGLHLASRLPERPGETLGIHRDEAARGKFGDEGRGVKGLACGGEDADPLSAKPGR